mmetsp:Transcript_32805/g.65298  ORF Transcript_32805/g.65298 Transcript_32805/m.65298 type:complete len:255 (-) Transcript_32805:183-947(-)|eukprot:CAMPEP_0174718280 /NCGR_PEP_ID=MMETSP1094-20130205/28467_1 /TAXON_ID=156173 /ORGANISM="Chrysochromulina brevifilum, Strain UTEX LB 985" /LENGTH=254 /DNA_ID=CAMNT_0015918343 /DNA_START=141 /DNA_END=905 /DNA_ORIENTATION=+
MGFMSNVTDHKTGCFRDWKEDDEVADVTLPLPTGTVKKADIVCIITAESLHVRHVGQQKTLLRAEPLAGPVIAEESTWYLQGEVLMISLAKQWRKETKSDQYWGASLAAKGGCFECYLTPAEVKRAREEREREEKKSEEERLARVRASKRQLRAQETAPPPKQSRRRGHSESTTGERPMHDPADDRAIMRDEGRSQSSGALTGLDWRAVALAAAGLLLVELVLSQWRGMDSFSSTLSSSSRSGSSPWYEVEETN